MPTITNEKPFLVIPALAEHFEVKGALLLLQLHKKLREEGQTIEQKRWYCQSYEDWYTQFPFLRKSTIKQVFRKLEAQGIVHASDRFNIFYVDRTKWYSLDYAKLEAMTGVTAEVLDCYLT